MKQYKGLTCWLSRDFDREYGADAIWTRKQKQDSWGMWGQMSISPPSHLLAESSGMYHEDGMPTPTAFLGTRKLFGCKPGECVKLVRDAVGEPWRRAEG